MEVPLGILLGVALITAFVIFMLWLDDYISGDVRIKFETFRTIYNICPNKWSFTVCNSYFKTPYERIDVKFGLIDWLRFKSWLREKKKSDKRANEIEVSRRLVESWQEDIENYKEAAQIEIEQMRRRIER